MIWMNTFFRGMSLFCITSSIMDVSQLEHDCWATVERIEQRSVPAQIEYYVCILLHGVIAYNPDHKRHPV